MTRELRIIMLGGLGGGPLRLLMEDQTDEEKQELKEVLAEIIPAEKIILNGGQKC